MLDHNFKTYLPGDLLVKVDRCSMAVSLETRCPLLDSGLVDFAGRLPDHFKIAGLTTKKILRETCADLYAPELLKRPKRGFAVPLKRWLIGPMREQFEGMVRPRDARIYQFLNYELVQQLLFSGADWRIPQASQAFALWTLEEWLRQVQQPITGAPLEAARLDVGTPATTGSLARVLS
jgi:asparagine synthase (glutamine-hydrolysing)